MRTITVFVVATAILLGITTAQPQRTVFAEEVTETIVIDFALAGRIYYTEHVYNGPVQLHISGIVTLTTSSTVQQSDAFYTFPPPIFRQDGQGVLWINGLPPSIDRFFPAYNPDHVYEHTLEVSHSKIDFWLGNFEHDAENEFDGALTVTVTGTVSGGGPIPAPDPPMPGGEPIADSAFYDRWARTDGPVIAGQSSRTWMWGIGPFTTGLRERYVEAENGERLVQYFDKSRMEITDPSGDAGSIWYVTNGLLVVELVTGRMQVGDSAIEVHAPAQVNVAGDPGGATGPTYATFINLLGAPAMSVDSTITTRVNRDGVVTDDESLAAHGVTATHYVPETKHVIASPFWTFMSSSGIVYDDGLYEDDALFTNPFYATGLPITEAYWATVQVGGQARDVLMQCFERRCLTYTPDNPAAWQVEAGNVGLHYYAWRYGSIPTAASVLNAANW